MYQQPAMLPFSPEDVDRLSAEVVARHSEWLVARDDAKAAAASATEAKAAFEQAMEQLKKARAHQRGA